MTVPSNHQMFSASRRALLGMMLIGVSAVSVSQNAFAQSRSLTGNWSFAWQGAQDDYTGTLAITTRVNDNSYRGRLVLRRSSGGTVTQNASIAVQGDQVSIIGSNPSVKTWNPDRFYVKLSGNSMEGFSRDAAGQQGKRIVFTRR